MPEPQDTEENDRPEFVTLDSGARKQFESGMQRDLGEGKPRPDLIFAASLPPQEQLIWRLIMLMTRGAEKYDARNWEKASGQEELDRFRESVFRHFLQWYLGMNPEEDHAVAVIFNLMGAEYVKFRLREGNASTS